VDQYFETQIINIGGADPKFKVSGTFRLVFEDTYGEKWTTGPIPVDGGADKSSEVRAALQALPNSVVQDVTVTSLAISTKGVRYHVRFDGGSNTATVTGNPGDLPNMGCDSSELAVSIVSASVGFVNTNATWLDLSSSVDVSAIMIGDVLTGADGFVMRVLEASFDSNFKVASVRVNAVCNCSAFDIFRRVENGVECTVSDRAPLMPSTWAATYVGILADIADGDKQFNLTAVVHSVGLSVGDRLQLTNGTTTQVVTITAIDKTDKKHLSTKEALLAFPATSTKVYFWGKGTTENSVCSGRGLCDTTSGLCKCFKGYTMDNCSRQNALAM